MISTECGARLSEILQVLGLPLSLLLVLSCHWCCHSLCLKKAMQSLVCTEEPLFSGVLDMADGCSF